jgi:glycosyltransferase involved in cell wall biosynthesis
MNRSRIRGDDLPTFSLVIPNLNQSHYLPFALESLRCQSTPVQLAVMDGGSTDNFAAVLKRYADIVAYSRSAADGGQSAAIHEGLMRMDGEIVSWLNADDYYFPGALDRVAACFAVDPDLDVVYGDAVHVTGEGMFLSYFPPIQAFDAARLTRTCFICQPAAFVRRSAYERSGGVDSALRYTMDWDLWCRLAADGAKFRYLPEPLAAVRYYPGTKTLSGDPKRYQEAWRIERKYGGRLLPRTWPGLYLYDLMHKPERSPVEKAAFLILESLRSLKHGLGRLRGTGGKPPQTIYGFHRWEPLVDGCCTIHLPWYDSRLWKRVHLQMAPGDGMFEVALNDASPVTIRAQGGRLVIDVPRREDPNRTISIRRCDGRQWKLIHFGCGFE